ncbi:MAG TPA: hypothetical protein QGF58_15495 [Myxococcota bacterium]|nr:hypothetical protein [Myxococcota bacterium]
MSPYKPSPSNVLGILGLSFARTGKAFPVLFVLAVLVGGVGHWLMWQAGVLALPHADPTNPQSQLIYSELTKLFVGAIWFTITFPIIDAVTIYAWRRFATGQDFSAKKALNWAVGRYGRMFGPHAKAFLTITAGMVIIVPGILFGLQYAFVDAITATDDKSRSPLKRSAKLTRGRRGRILRAWLPYAIWYLPAFLVFVYQAEAGITLGDFEISPHICVVVFGTFDVLVLAVMEMAMFGLYEERVADAQRAKAAREARDADIGTNVGTNVETDTGAETETELVDAASPDADTEVEDAEEGQLVQK